MPITLTTAYDPGDHDPGNTYPKATIVAMSFELLSETVHVTVQFGDDVSGDWVTGPGAKRRTFIINNNPTATPPDDTIYTDLLATVTLASETVHDAVKRILYDHLQAKYPELAGTIG